MSHASRSGLSMLWRRELAHYPRAGVRALNLGIIVLTTVLFYYQYYVISGVAAQVMSTNGMTFTYYMWINVISAFASAVTSAAGGITDKYGRANLVVVGLLGCALVCILGFPNAHSSGAVMFWYVLLGALEGVVLVATPALVRDFSPQVGRATAMGFWTIGPVAGALISSFVISKTIGHVGSWQDEYAIAGWAGLGVFVLALLFLRELAPGVRDQVIVSEEDIALAEARARGIDVEASLKHPVRQLMHFDVVGSAVAISVYLAIYFIAIGVFPVFFQTVFGYSTSQANELGYWMWGFQVFALIAVGWLSDRLAVRKPFMIVGAVGSIVATYLIIHQTGVASTSFDHWKVLLIALAFFLGLTFAPWMAGFTETVERRNPALTGSGLAIWGFTVRLAVTAVLVANPYVVKSVTTLVQDGAQVQALVAGADPALTPAQNAVVQAVAADPTIAAKAQALEATYATELAAAQKLDPATQAALAANPADQAAAGKALVEISGASPADVAKTMQINAQYGAQLQTAQAIDAATQGALLANPNDPAALQKAVGDIVAALHVTPAVATQRLAALATVPTADLLFMKISGAPVVAAAATLQSLAKVPVADQQFLGKYAALANPVVQQKLQYLQATGPKVQQAAKDSPGQWQTYFWWALIGQIIFLPMVFFMAGFWDPRRARKAAAEHHAAVQAQLAATKGI
ncbi:hypothetical protein Back2_29380 [Nocardioides baekrokdamisoli]|uniref:Major facilitator superfamily (MFS) profile domain-containing protein n=1 Tax=Nocardioides baekrokdamisoli TaxID=1804624 RepID=A0A3G9IY97_9ACTN|nr:MFS transporter [Nocardioides baekrokdamisoli]BBH18651.1 hypothetical protein Back2_29380 [Nocardioides baekrokdamisoli]